MDFPKIVPLVTLVVLLYFGQSLCTLGQTDVDQVDESLVHALDTFKDFRLKQKQFKDDNIDGFNRTRGFHRQSRLLRRIRSGKHKVAKARYLLYATKELCERTGQTVTQLLENQDIVDEWRAVLGATHLENVVDFIVNNTSRRKRQTTDDNSCPEQALVCDEYPTFSNMDGTCHNLNNGMWGAADATQRRLEQAYYNDTVDQIRTDLKSAREISNIAFKRRTSDATTPLETFNTIVSFAWGQFLDHDVVLTPVETGRRGASITCCRNDALIDREECLPITIVPNNLETTFDHSCMEFVRSAPSTNPNCDLGPKQVLNQITSFLDASNVYGSANSVANGLRESDNGHMTVRDEGGNDMLPAGDDDTCIIQDTDPDGECSDGGDSRLNVQPTLTGLHLLFVREHNRIAEALESINTDWNRNRVFRETRKIVIALMQQITYSDYMNNVLNQETRDEYDLNLLDTGYSTDYDDTINPTISVEFSTAAFRFGHSQIVEELAYILSGTDELTNQTSMSDALENPYMLEANSGNHVSDLARYMLKEVAARVDRFIADPAREGLFAGSDLDLGALNIQRGRDHGLQPYVKYLQHCGLDVPESFDQLVNHTAAARQILENAYDTVGDIELYVGGLLENRLTASYVGNTFACIIGEQFRALKLGDSYWYEREENGFTAAQLAEIRKVRLSKLFCDNFEIDEAPRNAFRQPGPTNGNAAVACDSLGDMSMDLTQWQEI